MKTKQELISMLIARLTEFEDGKIRKSSDDRCILIHTELVLLCDILGNDINEELWERIETALIENGYPIP